MSNVYIRSQNREKLYIFGISFNSLQYEEQHDYKRGKEAATHHTICIADGCLEEIAEYESKERCIEVLDEIEKVCGSYLYAAGSMGLIRGSTPMQPMATVIPRVYQMPNMTSRIAIPFRQSRDSFLSFIQSPFTYHSVFSLAHQLSRGKECVTL